MCHRPAFFRRLSVSLILMTHWGLLFKLLYHVLWVNKHFLNLNLNKVEDTENHLLCHIMNLLWLLSDNGPQIHFGGYLTIVALQKWKSRPTSNKRPLTMTQTRWCVLCRFEATSQLLHTEGRSSQADVSVNGRDLYLLKPRLGPPKKFQYT